jgi:putative membrane protein
MVGFIVMLVVNAIALVVAIEVVPEVDFDWQAFPLGLLALAVIFGAVNAAVKPIVKALALPISLFTLGLVGLVINLAMLLLTAFIGGQVGIDFTIAGFPPDLGVETIVYALIAAIIISVVSTVVSLVFSTRRVVGL